MVGRPPQRASHPAEQQRRDHAGGRPGHHQPRRHPQAPAEPHLDQQRDVGGHPDDAETHGQRPHRGSEEAPVAEQRQLHHGLAHPPLHQHERHERHHRCDQQRHHGAGHAASHLGEPRDEQGEAQAEEHGTRDVGPPGLPGRGLGQAARARERQGEGHHPGEQVGLPPPGPDLQSRGQQRAGRDADPHARPPHPGGAGPVGRGREAVGQHGESARQHRGAADPLQDAGRDEHPPGGCGGTGRARPCPGRRARRRTPAASPARPPGPRW